MLSFQQSISGETCLFIYKENKSSNDLFFFLHVCVGKGDGGVTVETE